MTYVPQESEKRATAIIQSLAGLFFFLPPLVALQFKSARRSPYIKYWSKVCLYWSMIMSIIIITAAVCSGILHVSSPWIILWIVHFVFCITGAMSAYFNTPFRYWFVANKCCEAELGDVYGQLIGPAPQRDRQ